METASSLPSGGVTVDRQHADAAKRAAIVVRANHDAAEVLVFGCLPDHLRRLDAPMRASLDQ